MNLEGYEWDLDFRWYHFHCDDCEYDVSLSESITKGVREINQKESNFLEPLTKEEMDGKIHPNLRR